MLRSLVLAMLLLEEPQLLWLPWPAWYPIHQAMKPQLS